MCDTAEIEQTKLEAAQLAAGYFKAMFFERIELANVLFEQLRNISVGCPYCSLEGLYENGRISIMDLSFCKNYLETERD